MRAHIASPQFEASIDGITLVQEYIEAPASYITRAEFIGGKFLYAVRVNTADGFELCPADACQVGDEDEPVPNKFSILEDFRHPIILKYEEFLRSVGIDIAGIEFIVDKHGELFTYDINTNTNYNADAEQEVDVSGMAEIARYLGQELLDLKDASTKLAV